MTDHHHDHDNDCNDHDDYDNNCNDHDDRDHDNDNHYHDDYDLQFSPVKNWKVADDTAAPCPQP